MLKVTTKTGGALVKGRKALVLGRGAVVGQVGENLAQAGLFAGAVIKNPPQDAEETAAAAAIATMILFGVAWQRKSKKITGPKTKAPLWSSTKSKTSVENAYGHWTKHGAEFPEYVNAKQYVEGAHKFVNSPPASALTKTRPNGDKLIYDPATNTFAVQAVDCAPKTMFRPTDGINYWNKQ